MPSCLPERPASNSLVSRFVRRICKRVVEGHRSPEAVKAISELKEVIQKSTEACGSYWPGNKRMTALPAAIRKMKQDLDRAAVELQRYKEAEKAAERKKMKAKATREANKAKKAKKGGAEAEPEGAPNAKKAKVASPSSESAKEPAETTLKEPSKASEETYQTREEPSDQEKQAKKKPKNEAGCDELSEFLADKTRLLFSQGRVCGVKYNAEVTPFLSEDEVDKNEWLCLAYPDPVKVRGVVYKTGAHAFEALRWARGPPAGDDGTREEKGGGETDVFRDFADVVANASPKELQYYAMYGAVPDDVPKVTKKWQEEPNSVMNEMKRSGLTRYRFSADEDKELLFEVLFARFTQCRSLGDRLLLTAGKRLVYHSTRDLILGGKVNLLGEMLQKARRAVWERRRANTQRVAAAKQDVQVPVSPVLSTAATSSAQHGAGVAKRSVAVNKSPSGVKKPSRFLKPEVAAAKALAARAAAELKVRIETEQAAASPPSSPGSPLLAAAPLF